MKPSDPSQLKIQVNEHRKVSELARQWEDRVGKQNAIFEHFAQQIVQADTQLISNTIKMRELSMEFHALNQKQGAVQQSIEAIQTQQETLGRLLQIIQESLTNKQSPVATTTTHQKANVLAVQLDDLDRQVEQLGEEISCVHKRQYAQPVSGLCQVLNAQSKTLELLQDQTIGLAPRVAKMERRVNN